MICELEKTDIVILSDVKLEITKYINSLIKKARKISIANYES
tara:strand:+ start:943 stop:1068 length:126 start_codon:yes stop_codon:yes gene_type:complete